MMGHLAATDPKPLRSLGKQLLWATGKALPGWLFNDWHYSVQAFPTGPFGKMELQVNDNYERYYRLLRIGRPYARHLKSADKV